MAFFRKKVNEEEFVYVMTDYVNKSANTVTNFFHENLGCKKNDDLAFESIIHTLWVVTVAIPIGNDRILDLIHQDYCNFMDFISDENWFLTEVDKRYKVYNQAFNEFLEYKNVEWFGGTIVNVIKNNKLRGPNPGDDINMVYASLATSQFQNQSQATFGFIKNLKKKFKLEKILINLEKY